MNIKLSQVLVAGAAVLVVSAGAVKAWEYTPSWQSSNPYSSGWVNPYDNTLVNGMRDMMNMQLRHSMQSQQLYTSQMISRGAMQSSMGGRASRYKGTRAQKAQINSFVKYKGTMYKPGAKFLMPEKVAAVFVKQPGQPRKNAAVVFSKFLKFHREQSSKNKAPANDIARNMAMAIGYSYGYYSGQGDVAQSGLDTLRTKLRRELAADPKFRAMSDEDKQKLDETILIMGYLVAFGYSQAHKANDAKAKEGFRKLAGVALQSMLGVEPNRVKLEKTGLVIAKV